MNKNLYTTLILALVILISVSFIFFIKLSAKPIDLPSKIILYNTHSFEKYHYGENVKEVTRKIHSKLQALSVDSTFLDVDTSEIAFLDYATKCYPNSRKSITNNLTDYSNSILLDIHADNASDSIYLKIGEQSPNFKENKKFANLLCKEFKKIDNTTKLE